MGILADFRAALRLETVRLATNQPARIQTLVENVRLLRCDVHAALLLHAGAHRIPLLPTAVDVDTTLLLEELPGRTPSPRAGPTLCDPQPESQQSRSTPAAPQHSNIKVCVPPQHCYTGDLCLPLLSPCTDPLLMIRTPFVKIASTLPIILLRTRRVQSITAAFEESQS